MLCSPRRTSPGAITDTQARAGEEAAAEEETNGEACRAGGEGHQQAVNQAPASACQCGIQREVGGGGSPWDPERRKEEEVQQRRDECLSVSATRPLDLIFDSEHFGI